MTVFRLRPRRDMFSDWSRLSREMDRMFAGLGGGRALESAGVYPPVNLSEDEENYYLRAELPGVDPQDLELTVINDTLTLKGERRIAERENASFHRRERAGGVFNRVMSLPGQVNSTAVSARSEHGLLTVTLPKAEEAKPRQIKVNRA